MSGKYSLTLSKTGLTVPIFLWRNQQNYLLLQNTHLNKRGLQIRMLLVFNNFFEKFFCFVVAIFDLVYDVYVGYISPSLAVIIILTATGNLF